MIWIQTLEYLWISTFKVTQIKRSGQIVCPDKAIDQMGLRKKMYSVVYQEAVEIRKLLFQIT